jgi:hypothetical protein
MSVNESELDVKGAAAASAAATERDFSTPLHKQKLDLGVRNLQLLNRQLLLPWWRRPSTYITAVLLLLVTAISLLAAYVNGYFDLKSLELSAKRERLQLDIEKFEQHGKELQSRNAQLVQDLYGLRREREALEAARDALIARNAVLERDKRTLTGDLHTTEQKVRSMSILADWLDVLQYFQTYAPPTPVDWEERTPALIAERRRPVLTSSATWRRLAQDINDSELRGISLTRLDRASWQERFIGYVAICAALRDTTFCGKGLEAFRGFASGAHGQLKPFYVFKFLQELGATTDQTVNRRLCETIRWRDVRLPTSSDSLQFANAYGALQELFVGTAFVSQCPDIVLGPLLALRADYEEVGLMYTELPMLSRRMAPPSARLASLERVCGLVGSREDGYSEGLIGVRCAVLIQKPRLLDILKNDRDFFRFYKWPALMDKLLNGRDVSDADIP